MDILEDEFNFNSIVAEDMYGRKYPDEINEVAYQRFDDDDMGLDSV